MGNMIVETVGKVAQGEMDARRKEKMILIILTRVRKIMVQLAHYPVDGGFGGTVGVDVERHLAREGDAAQRGGDGHEFGRPALSKERVRGLE